MNTASIPLCVDLDGTLIKTDTLQEAIILLLKRNPLAIFQLLFWLLQGRAYLKQQVAQRVALDAATLPYNQKFLEWIKQQKSQGRSLVLVTATDKAFADAVAQHLAIFDVVLASEGKINLRSKNKRDALIKAYGEGRYDYAGNDYPDIAVWQTAHKAIVVNAPAKLLAQMKKASNIGEIFAAENHKFKALIKACRPHQYAKNLLVFFPLVAAHQLFNVSVLHVTELAFVAFCLTASATYIINDLLDLAADRQHINKQHRPFAAGNLTAATGLKTALSLLLITAVILYFLPAGFSVALGIYIFLTLSYSLKFKQIIFLDVIALACLYTIRVIAGGVVGDIYLSQWLLLFCIFLFLSLAFIKRYTELTLHKQNGKQQALGRGYHVDHLKLLSTVGILSGAVSILIFACYIHSPNADDLYWHPAWLWGLVVILIYWMARIWRLAYRHRLHEDPVYFALRDWQTYVLVFIALIFLFLSAA